MTVIMKPWDEREDPDLPAFMARVTDEFSQYPESKVYLSTPPVIPGLGTSGGFEMALEARGDLTYEELQRASDTLVYYASQRKELARAFRNSTTTWTATGPSSSESPSRTCSPR